MKLLVYPREGGGEFIAPHTGAWIETATMTAGDDIVVIAPHTGAWIETNLIGYRLP